MKILPVNSNKNLRKQSFKQNNRIDELSGLQQVREYNERLAGRSIKLQEKEQNLIDVMYNSIFALNSAGKYDSAKIIADTIRERADFEEDFLLNNELGDMNRKNGDIISANMYYKKALLNAPDDDFALKLDTFKKLGETDVLLGIDNSEAINELAKTDEPFHNMIYLYLHSLVEAENANLPEAGNDVDAAYKIMSSRGIKDDGIIFQQALSLSDAGNYGKSNAILQERLDELSDLKQIYTQEFLNYMILLGINKFKTAESGDYSQTITILNNASQIAGILHNNIAKETADYGLAKSLLLSGNEKFKDFASKLLKNAQNPKIRINLHIMLADNLSKESVDEAKEHYLAAVDLLKNENNNRKNLFSIYEKIKAVSPQDSAWIDEEIENLNSADLFNTNFLMKILFNAYKNNDIEKIGKIAAEVLNSKDSEDINRSVAKIYLGFANIKEGKDLNASIKNIDENIENLKTQITKNRSKNDKNLRKMLYYAYQNRADIMYNSMHYYEAANSANKADDYFDETKYSSSQIARQKIITTLYNYKAQNYDKAEKYALQYLDVLLDKKISSTSPKKVTNEVSEILTGLNDTQKRKIASAYETLGLINLKKRNFADSREYFLCAVDVRERLKDKDFQLANSYAALARIAILTGWKNRNKLSSKEMHAKSLEILKLKYPDAQVTKEEEAFHKEYYGATFASFGKWLKFTQNSRDRIIEKFRCYNKELSICE